MTTEQRVAELKKLGKSKDVVGAVDKLARSLDSLNDEVRDATLEALREQLRAHDFPKLLAEKQTPLRTQANVLKALRYLKEPKYLPLVVAALKHPEVTLRAEAALVLSVYGAAEAEAELVAALADPHKDVRYYAADALGTLKTDAAKKAVGARLEVETDPTVQFSLQQAQKKQRQ